MGFEYGSRCIEDLAPIAPKGLRAQTHQSKAQDVLELDPTGGQMGVPQAGVTDQSSGAEVDVRHRALERVDEAADGLRRCAAGHRRYSGRRATSSAPSRMAFAGGCPSSI